MRPARRDWLLGGGALAASGALPTASCAAGPPPRPPPAPPSPALARPFAFALIGDLPYGEADEARLAALLAATDTEPLAFVLHVGDLKASHEDCSDALFERRIAILSRSAHPLVLLPGDNDWTDCDRGRIARAPLERLDALRRRAGSSRGPLGAADRGEVVSALRFERQHGQPENLRWRVGGVRFVAAHVVGSDNARKGYPGAADAFALRAAGNRSWVLETLALALAERADALAIAFHANPDWQPGPRSGFADWIAVLREVADGFPGPILLLHGDSHRFRVDRPLRDAAGRVFPRVTRIESFGWPFTSQWVRIGYDPSTPQRFTVSSREVPAPRHP
jgi:hypothetical protein